MSPAVFLDRDGTLIEDVPYLTDPHAVRLVQGAGEALRRLSAAGFRLVVVTNQSAVGRGLLTEDGLAEIHTVLRDRLAAAGVELDAIYSCPVAPRGDDPLAVEHPDRKPAPGMLLRAAREHGIDLARSWMVGDAVRDTIAGRSAGCRGTILIAREGETGIPHASVDHVAGDLTGAVAVILRATEEAGTR